MLLGFVIGSNGWVEYWSNRSFGLFVFYTAASGINRTVFGKEQNTSNNKGKGMQD